MDRRYCARALALLLLGLCVASPAEAFIDLGGDFQDLDPNAPIDQGLVDALVLTLGGAVDQRPGLSGGPLSEVGAGFDLSIQMSAVKPPDAYYEQLGAGAGDPGSIFLPIPRLMLHKGLGPRATGGISAIGYAGNLILGADITFAVVHGEEGPTVALRLAVAHARLSMSSGGSGNLEFRTNTYTPQILISRRLEFADPYLGLGYSIMSGRITVPIDVGASTVELTQDGAARNFIAFLGVSFKLGPTGMRLGFEGNYSPSGMNSIGTRIGFQF